MKILFLTLGLLSLSFPVFAADEVIDIARLKSESIQALHVFPLKDSCIFSAKDVAQGLELVIEENKQTTVKILVTDADAITVKEQNEADGSYKREYQVAGVGKLTIIHTDDVYNAIELTDGKYTSRCVVEF